jgi:glyoxylase-like metal-dependent hydrolase (beta-lactamase superfamily II)
VKIYLIVNREFDQNCYCLFDESKEAVVIDPGSPLETIKSFLEKEELNLKAVLLTHGHFDHIISANELSAWSGAPIYASRSEARLLREPRLNLSIFGLGKPLSLIPGIWLDEGAEVKFGNESLTVINTPGHTPGGICFYNKDQGAIFTGDTMFWETVGRTDFNLSDGEALTRSIKEKLLPLPKDTVVYPGHGRPTDISHERMIHSEIS